MYRNVVKPVLDFILAITIILICSPILFGTWIALLLLNNGRAIFKQERPGYKGKPFVILKFKTMNDKRNSHGGLLPDNVRLTRFGNLVRKLSIDELPQLFNVVKGDMSLIGPRPLLFKYIPLYSAEQRRRHDVRPGITGWAQVNGRNAIGWTRKFELDVYYVDNMSFLLDLKIFWLTILKIVKREGINQSKTRPMEPFNGSN